MTTSLSDAVAAEVRAELGRKQLSGADLARHMKVSRTYVHRRLTGETPFDINDLERVSELLEIPPARFLAAAA